MDAGLYSPREVVMAHGWPRGNTLKICTFSGRVVSGSTFRLHLGQLIRELFVCYMLYNILRDNLVYNNHPIGDVAVWGINPLGMLRTSFWASDNTFNNEPYAVSTPITSFIYQRISLFYRIRAYKVTYMTSTADKWRITLFFYYFFDYFTVFVHLGQIKAYNPTNKIFLSHLYNVIDVCPALYKY